MNRWLGRGAGRPRSRTSGFLTRLRTNSAGTTLALAGAALVPIAGMIGSGLDIARAYMAEAKLQNACDAAALAARREMQGAAWTTAAELEGERFFNFNFPAGTMAAENISVTVDQSATDDTTVEVVASADIPTTVMGLFGKTEIPIAVACDADQDYGNNDIMLVLDVTGSMNCRPGVSGSCGNVEQSGSKASRLRASALSLYRTLKDAANTRTRYGIMPYSVTVNVGRNLATRDILRTTYYHKCSSWNYQGNCTGYTLTPLHIDNTSWSGSNTNQRINAWRTSGSACIEERPSESNAAHPIRISNISVSRNDIDRVAANNNDTAWQWGRYDANEQQGESGSACPAEATKLRTYNGESGFQNAINAATSSLSGNTYHDIGMIWAARYLSSTGMFASTNPTEWNEIPVAKHIVYLTDGKLEVSTSTYSAYGQHNREQRLQGSSSQNQRHVDRFLATCTRAKTMGITIWVIALDVGDTADIAPCATSSGHFFVSDGSDLEDVFARIGQGIGRLRLTQ